MGQKTRPDPDLYTVAHAIGADKVISTAFLAVGIAAETVGGAVKATVNYLR